jgi:hypothetical protein
MNELSPDAKELLRSARSALSPNEARIAAVRTMLDARVGASVMHAPGGGLAGQAASTVGAASWGAAHVIALSLLAAASVGGALVLASRHGLARNQTPALAAPSVPAAGAVAGSALGERPALAPSRSAEQPSLTPAQLPEASASSRPAHPARRRYRPIEETQVASPPAIAPPASPGSQDSPPQADAPAATTPPVQSPEVPDDSLAHEISLLRAARAALEAGDPEEALALLHRHARLWPQGVLAEERLATRVLALCALRRFAEARTAAHQLESVAPHSPHLARVRASCAGDPATGAP